MASHHRVALPPPACVTPRCLLQPADRVVGLGTESTGRPELPDCFPQLEAPVAKLTAGC